MKLMGSVGLVFDKADEALPYTASQSCPASLEELVVAFAFDKLIQHLGTTPKVPAELQNISFCSFTEGFFERVPASL